MEQNEKVAPAPFNFAHSLVAFNSMYGLPVNQTPTLLGSQRLKDLKQILLDEISEVDEIIQQMEHYEFVANQARVNANNGIEMTWTNQAEMRLSILTDLADWLGDIQVYAGSETAKWGIPLNETLKIIMDSNMSKLGADGLPIVNEAGKVQKGPNYWKPEPKIEAMLSRRLVDTRAAELRAKVMIQERSQQQAAQGEQGA